MSQTLVLNSLSLPFGSTPEAEAALPEFLTVLAKLRPFQLNLIRMGAVLDTRWHTLELAPGYLFQHWLAQHQSLALYRDKIRILKSFLVNQPEIDPPEEQDVRNQLDAGLPDTQGHDVFRACVYYGAYLLSFASQTLWQQAEIKLWVERLEAEQPASYALANFASPGHVAYHQPRLIAEQDRRLTSGKDLWQAREAIFPHLCWLGKMSDLMYWSHSLAVLDKAKDALRKLNAFAEQWQAEAYPDYQHAHLRNLGLDVSGESQSVAQNAAKRKQREHYLPNGQKVYCENHIKLAQGFRLYFYPDASDKSMYVVYLGPHLKL